MALLSLRAVQLREAAMHSDVRAKLKDAVNDKTSGNGKYVDHSGDGDSGDVVYEDEDGDTKKASYETGKQGGKAVCNVDWDNAANVVPCTTYDEEADDDDHYASMEEAFAKLSVYSELPLYERFISKGERNNADEGSFAGKGKSFPILKPGDVMAAVHAMGRAGSGNYGMAQLKANIIRIAKAKGWASSLPKAWQGDSADAKEGLVSRGTEQGNDLRLSESAESTESMLSLREAGGRGEYEIKLIAPGPGASAYYPADVLKRDGPSAFPAQTKVYLNHPTRAQEADGPGNRDVHRLAGVTTRPAEWKDSHAKGPGLYSNVKVFADHAGMLEEKAPYLAMSIMANGTQAVEAGRKLTKDGLPLLARLHSGESVDVVPMAGAGGMLLTEAARTNSQEGEMTLQEAQKLIDDGIAKALTPLRERAIKGDATVIAGRVLSPLSLNEAAKQMVVENVLRGELPLKENALDETKFTELVTAEAKRVGAVLGASFPGVHGMGAGDPVDITLSKKERKALKEAAKQEEEEAILVFESLGMPRDAAILAAKGRAA